jgi:PTH1 family peptidyl-tRNA hydrolase
MQQENIPLEQVLVIVDDLALPFGALRLKGKGSDAGHNGLKNIQELVGTQNYARLRFGIGNDFHPGGQVDYVLGKFSPEQEVEKPKRIAIACDIIKSFCLAGLNITMNQYNNK